MLSTVDREDNYLNLMIVNYHNNIVTDSVSKLFSFSYNIMTFEIDKIGITKR